MDSEIKLLAFEHLLDIYAAAPAPTGGLAEVLRGTRGSYEVVSGCVLRSAAFKSGAARGCLWLGCRVPAVG